MRLCCLHMQKQGFSRPCLIILSLEKFMSLETWLNGIYDSTVFTIEAVRLKFALVKLASKAILMDSRILSYGETLKLSSNFLCLSY